MTPLYRAMGLEGGSRCFIPSHPRKPEQVRAGRCARGAVRLPTSGRPGTPKAVSEYKGRIISSLNAIRGAHPSDGNDRAGRIERG